MNVYAVTTDGETRYFAAAHAIAAMELDWQAYLAESTDADSGELDAPEAELRSQWEEELFQGVHLIGELENWPEASTP